MLPVTSSSPSIGRVQFGHRRLPEGKPPEKTVSGQQQQSLDENRDSFFSRIRETLGQMRQDFADFFKDKPRPPLPLQYVCREGGMTDSPGYYAGLPASLKDVDGRRLMKMHDLLEEHNGTEAANDFARLILSMDDLAASRVVVAMGALQRLGWRFPEGVTPEMLLSGNRLEDTVIADLDTDYGQAIMFFGTVAHKTSNGKDDTEIIKQQFRSELKAVGKDFGDTKSVLPGEDASSSAIEKFRG